jgi:phosphoribosylaminoimidazolecarboxamide formyltransferase/IMP cyclohydrolase
VPDDRQRALLSVTDRTGLDELARALAGAGYRLIATAGTAGWLRERGFDCEDVEEHTGVGELLAGRVKTLHPAIFAPLLARPDSESDRADLERRGWAPIRVVAVNLYRFAEAADAAIAAEAARSGASAADAHTTGAAGAGAAGAVSSAAGTVPFAEAGAASGAGPVSVAAQGGAANGQPRSVLDASLIEEIDVGGVALLRAGAKNFAAVSVLCEPALYPEFVAALAQGGPTLEQRRRWAARAFALVAAYDARIARAFDEDAERGLPPMLQIELPLHSRLRYGENPWALGAFYHGAAGDLPRQLGGKVLSYNNLLDVDACLRLLAPVQTPEGFPADAPPLHPALAAIVKHTLPCGLAAAPSAAQSLQAALDADPTSAYGGVVALNQPVDEACARILKPVFLEVIAAPAFTSEALDVLQGKKNVRLLTFAPDLPSRLEAGLSLRSALGGVLAQEPDPSAEPDIWRVVTPRAPTTAQWRDLLFAFGAVRQVKSNAAVVVHDQVAIGICGGQTNRVTAVELACRRAGTKAAGAVLATDGFFPFADGLEAAAAAGIGAVVAPSGSIRDAEVVEAARRADVALVFTKRRYFLH